jgi:hypothetical protein
MIPLYSTSAKRECSEEITGLHGPHRTQMKIRVQTTKGLFFHILVSPILVCLSYLGRKQQKDEQRGKRKTIDV